MIKEEQLSFMEQLIDLPEGEVIERDGLLYIKDKNSFSKEFFKDFKEGKVNEPPERIYFKILHGFDIYKILLKDNFTVKDNYTQEYKKRIYIAENTKTKEIFVIHNKIIEVKTQSNHNNNTNTSISKNIWIVKGLRLSKYPFITKTDGSIEVLSEGKGIEKFVGINNSMIVNMAIYPNYIVIFYVNKGNLFLKIYDFLNNQEELFNLGDYDVSPNDMPEIVHEHKEFLVFRVLKEQEKTGKTVNNLYFVKQTNKGFQLIKLNDVFVYHIIGKDVYYTQNYGTSFGVFKNGYFLGSVPLIYGFNKINNKIQITTKVDEENLGVYEIEENKLIFKGTKKKDFSLEELVNSL